MLPKTSLVEKDQEEIIRWRGTIEKYLCVKQNRINVVLVSSGMQCVSWDTHIFTLCRSEWFDCRGAHNLDLCQTERKVCRGARPSDMKCSAFCYFSDF